MSKVVDFGSFKKNKRDTNPDQEVKNALKKLTTKLFGDNRTAKEVNGLFSEAKKLLKSRGVKPIRITHKDLPKFNKNQTIIFEKKKLAFSVSIPESKMLDSGWQLVPINLKDLGEAIDLVSIVLSKLTESEDVEQQCAT